MSKITVLKAKRRNLSQLQKVFYGGYCLPRRLFGSMVCTEFTDFELVDYCRFLDDVASLEDLILGLSELSPFADDALDVAEAMTPIDFSTFKLALIRERQIAKGLDAESIMPAKFFSLLLPGHMMMANQLAKLAAVSLSVAMIRNLEEKDQATHST